MSVPLLVSVIVVPVVIAIFLLVFLTSKYCPNLSHKKLTPNQKSIIEFHQEKGGTPYLLKKNSDDFRVVTCADMHMGTEECVFGITVLSRLIDKTHPDLLVFVGDNVCGRGDDYVDNKLIKMLEKKKVYYAFVLGNHDSEHLIAKDIREKYHNHISDEEYAKIQKKHRTSRFKTLMNSKYCVARLGDPKLFGVGNYTLNLKNASGTIKTLYFFDSGDYINGLERKAKGSERRSYDHVHDDQLNWYKEEVKKNPNDSIAFLHIPLKEYYTAYKLSLFPFFHLNKSIGNNYEKPCYSDEHDNTFKVFKECGSTKVVIAGHDHKNDSVIKYRGIKLMYSLGLQYDGAYNRRKKNPKWFSFLYKLGFKCYIEGVSVLDLNKKKIKITPVYAEKENVFYGLEKYYKRAWLEDTHYELR